MATSRRMSTAILQRGTLQSRQLQRGDIIRQYASAAAAASTTAAAENKKTTSSTSDSKASTTTPSTKTAGASATKSTDSKASQTLPPPKVKVVLKDYDPYESLDPDFQDSSKSVADLAGAASWKSAIVLKFMNLLKMDIEENQAAPVAGRIYVDVCKMQAYHPPEATEFSDSAEFFYKDLGLTPSLAQWFQITSLHMWIMLVRMRALPEKYAPVYEQALVDGIFIDIERMLVSDYKIKSGRIINNTMKELNLLLRGSVLAYDEALMTNDAVFSAAIWRNIFGAKKEIDMKHVATLVKYARAHLYVLEKMSDFDFAVGRFTFLPPWLDQNPDNILQYQPPPLPSNKIFPGYESKFSRDN
ncbi:ubiquinol-cytochrome C chaperone-domain-containing protein [Myxozyma melibiosi]|uniref:Ubiquinol-cytochrome C chaperone-domain-containing protein n=1 Tax=Myxozyma melibiosi TaxID=54550 RepID=A0ABR1FAY0_9ASCO